MNRLSIRTQMITLIVVDKDEKYPPNLCSSTIEIPVDYAGILKILEEYL